MCHENSVQLPLVALKNHFGDHYYNVMFEVSCILTSCASIKWKRESRTI